MLWHIAGYLLYVLGVYVIREVATKRVLAKTDKAGPVLKKLFTESQGQLNDAFRLEHSARKTETTEADFVQFYPYPPHYIDLCISIVSGLRLQPGAPKQYGGSNRTIIKVIVHKSACDWACAM